MTNYVFLNVIADGPVNWKSPLTAPGQPGIKDCFMILADEDDGPQITAELSGLDGANLVAYSNAVATGAVVVGHSVEYHHGHLRAEMISRGTDPCDGRVQTICTMLALTGHVQKRNGRRGWPTFDEACDHFLITRAATETAEDNARCLMQVWRGMQSAGIHPDARLWRERNG